MPVPADDLPSSRAVPASDLPGAAAPSKPSLGADLGEAAKGAVEGALGTPMAVGRSLFQFGRQTPEQYDTSLFAKPQGERAEAFRQAGDVVGTIASPLPLKAASAAGKEAVKIGERIAPGAVGRAASLVERIAKPSDPNTLGEAIRAKLAPRFTQFEQTRQAEFQKWLASQGKKDVSAARADDPAFDAAFRKKYRELSDDVNQYADALGKHATGEAKDPIRLPSKAFSSRASVESLKRLSGGDEAFVNDLARQWVATELRRVTRAAARQGKSAEAANRAREWLTTAQSNWLSELPEVGKEAERFVDTMEKLAKTRKVAKWGAGAAALAGAEALGYHPLNWMRHQLGL